VRTKRLEPPDHFVDPESRTTKQEIQAQGILEDRAVEGVRWVRPYRSNPGAGLIKIGTSVIHLPDFITAELGDKLMIGTGRYQGRPVLLMRAVKENERGYSHYKNKTGTKHLVSSLKLVESLVKAGLKRGHYEPVKIQGGWMCERVKP
jgi:hypothetical protein